MTAIDIFIYFCLSDLGYVGGSIDLDQEIARLLRKAFQAVR
jgi:hypothetical protein